MTDTIKKIMCPACGSEMEKVSIPETGFALDICTNCGGIYFDNREYQHFNEEHEDITGILDSLKNKTFVEVDTSAQRICPSCGARMVKNFTGPKHEIEIDECYSCGGKFTDRDELIKIRAEYKTDEERSKAVVEQLYACVGQELRALEIKNQNISNKQHIVRDFISSIVKNII